jgi:hypothetical protein
LIEGFTSCILVDLVDASNDDQHSATDGGPGRRDAATLPFEEVMDVLRFYNPPGDNTHPTNIHEFWDGYKALFPNRVNLVSEVYREHHILKPQPDLVVDSVSIAGGIPVPGQIFQVRRTIRNAGNEKAVEASVNRFFLANGSTQVDLLFDGFGLGLTPPNLTPRASHTAVADVIIPNGTPAGIYTLTVCSDSFDNVPESAEGTASNCRGGDIIRLR